ncbi:MAG: GIY-YIG nuclease family protein [Clostridia bacterium]|nr:GIY-YIG nuclease family protein [Clostridia bacterium]
MQKDKKSYVYILTNKSHKSLYIGVTSDLAKRVNEHKSKTAEGFSMSYNTSILIYYEEYNEMESAILREKQLKGWVRKKKTDLISLHNPDWIELEV